MCALIVTIFFLMSLSIIIIAALKFLSANLNICVILESVSIIVWITFFCFFPMSGNFGLYPEHCEYYVNLERCHSIELRHQPYI